MCLILRFSVYCDESVIYFSFKFISNRFTTVFEGTIRPLKFAALEESARKAMDPIHFAVRGKHTTMPRVCAVMTW